MQEVLVASTRDEHVHIEHERRQVLPDVSESEPGWHCRGQHHSGREEVAGGEGRSSTSSTQGQGLPGPRPTAAYNARRERAGEERQAGWGTSGAGRSLQGDHLLREPLAESQQVAHAHIFNIARGCRRRTACRSHSTLPTSMGCDQAQSLAHEKRRGNSMAKKLVRLSACIAAL